MDREKCGLLAVPRTVPAQLTHSPTLRMPVLEFHCCQHCDCIMNSYLLVQSLLWSEREVVHMYTRIHAPCKVLGTLRTTAALMRVFMLFNLMALCHSYVNDMLSTDINITETTYSSQF
jgi:uncharacterized protein YuzB (UPF0349 family)